MRPLPQLTVPYPRRELVPSGGTENGSPWLCKGAMGVATYHAVITRRSTKFFLLGAVRDTVAYPAFASLPPPGQHRQHHLHQRLPRMRMMQVMLGMLPKMGNEGGKDLRGGSCKRS